MIENVEDFKRGILGRTGLAAGRLGVAASYGVPAAAVEKAFDHGVNYLFWGSRRTEAFAQALRNLRARRAEMIVVVQSYTRAAALLGWSLERALRAVHFDYADVLLLGWWDRPVPPRILDQARKMKDRGLVKFLAVSTHARTTVPAIAAGIDYDVVQFRYNAAHPGAERDIFPYLGERPPGMVAFTATSWGQLLGAGGLQNVMRGGRGIPAGERTPTAADCYRFVMSRPEVDVCMTGPADAAQMDQALEALRLGPLTPDELAWMQRVGRAVAGK